MYNPKKIIELLNDSKTPNKALLDYLGKNWNGSLASVINGDIRVSKLEKIADFFNVPIDYFFDRDCSNNGVMVNGSRNTIHHFSVGQSENEIKHLQAIIEEKEKRIALLEEMNELLKGKCV